MQNGHGESYYTLGGRSEKGSNVYFEKIINIFKSLHLIIQPSAIIVQLIAFSDPITQLPEYLDAMKIAGYEEINPFHNIDNERVVRTVPNRKWYARSDESSQHASKEIVLFHRPLV